MTSSKQILILAVLVLSGAMVLWLVQKDNTSANIVAEQTSAGASTPGQQPQRNPDAKQQQQQLPQTRESNVHQITLPHDDPEFPPGPGRELFIARCTVCHSLRYVTMQPDFPQKVWGKEVAKMINTFGAHISSEEAKQITEYLSTIKGSTPAGHESAKK